MIRNIIGNLRTVGFRTHFEPHRIKIILPKATSLPSQHSFPAFSTKSSPPSDTIQGINDWEQSLNDETRNRLFEIKVELRMHFEAGHKVCDPDKVTVKQWQHILSLKSENSRRNEYSYIGRRQHWSVREKEKKEERRIHGGEIKEAVLKKWSENRHIIYGLSHTALVPRIFPRTINASHDLKLIRAKQFQEQKVIFDCSYDQYMSPKFIRATASHLARAYSDNRKNSEPFDLHICNWRNNNKTLMELEKDIPSLRDPNFTIEVHNECFTDLYPRENLVYLSPYSNTFLSDYNCSDIFVIPAVVDKGYDGPITLAKPKQLRIRTAWFPINRYVPMSPAGKFLPLDIIIKMLLDFKNKRNWKEAIKHIPDRKLRQYRHPRQELTDVFNSKGKFSRMPNSNGETKIGKLPMNTGNPFKIDTNSKSKDDDGDRQTEKRRK